MYYYEDFISDCKLLKENYNDICEIETIGTSHDLRDIIAVRIGKGKKEITFCSGVHGREIINPYVLMRMCFIYLGIYKNNCCKNKLQQIIYETLLVDSKVKEIVNILNEFTFNFIPLLNPDGYMIALCGFDIIQNKELCIKENLNYIEWKCNARAIDINRNFNCKSWCSKFEGDFPNSENETKALIKFFEKYPQQGFIDFHSRGEEIYYYRHACSAKYNDIQKKIALKLAKCSGYNLVEPENEININDSGGNTVQYFSEVYGKPAITIETVYENAQFPLDEYYIDIVLKQVIEIPIIFANNLL